MKTLLLLFLFIGIANIGHAQQPSSKTDRTVEGTLKDQSKLPLAYVTISVVDSIKKPIATTISDEKGKFILQSLPAGNLTISMGLMGYTTKTMLLTKLGKEDLGNIVLELATNLLKEVAITAQGPIIAYQLDKKIFQPGRDVISQSGSATDLLSGVPSVNVSPAGVVSLRGNSNVLVLINGRKSGIIQGNALDQLPADQIDRVEIITNPSSRYEADGAAGIINIILKKNKKSGFNGQLKLVGGIPNETRINPSINYKSDRINLFSTFGIRLADYVGLYHTNQETTAAGKISLLNQMQNENRHDDGKMLYLGADVQLNEKSSITAAFLKNATNDHDFTKLTYNYATKGVGIDSNLVRNGESHEKRNYNQLEFNYTKNFEKPGKKHTIDLQYDFWNSNKDWELATQRLFPNPDALANIRTRSIGASKDLALQTDFILPLNSLKNLELGVKLENRKVTSDFLAEKQNNSLWQTIDGIDNKLNYNELIGGAYAQFGAKIGSFSYQFGLRFETTRINLRDRIGSYNDTKAYAKFFPTLNLSSKLTKSATLQASYSRRTSRPSLNMLYPFNELTDLNTRFIGNPELNPSFAHVLELGYLYRKSQFTLNPSIYYQYNSQVIVDYTIKNSNTIFITSPVNIDREIRQGIELSMLYNPNKWLQLSAEINGYRFSQAGIYANQDFGFTSETITSRFGSQLKFTKLFSVQGRYNFTGARQTAQIKEKAIHNIDMGISRNLFGEKATLLFDVTNLFSLRKYETITTGSTYYLQQDGRFNAARYKLTFVYRLNLKENQAIRQAKSGNRN